MKKLLSIVLTAAMVLSLAACSQSNSAEMKKDSGSTGAAETGVISSTVGGADAEFAEGGIYEESFACDGMVGGDVARPGTEWNGNSVQNVAGTLTAGVWNDNDHWSFWNDLYQYKSEWEEYRTMWAKPNVKRYFVTVANGDIPLENVSVKLVDSQNNTIWESKTDNSGKCYLFADATASSAVKITADDTHELDIVAGTDSYSFKLDSGENARKALDLMLMIDTTGSMGDELDYLKTELESIINRVASENGNVPIRVSVNFYRDDDDEYVVRPFEFTSDIKQAVSDLSAQSYDGGGDFPEAVDQALDNAINSHQWDYDSTKIMLLVLDAPSHETAEINAKMNDWTAAASAKGIRIIPVASSGVDKATEYELRDLAFKTGGQYVFLTDDSGVSSGQHITPTIGDYTVEKLNDLIVKLVGSYLENKPVAQYVDKKVEVEIVPEGDVTAEFVSLDNVQGSYVLNLTLNNTTPYEYSYTNYPYILEKLDESADEWQTIEMLDDVQWNDIMVALPSNNTTSYSMDLTYFYGALTEGTYRYSLNLWGEKGVYPQVEFNITDTTDNAGYVDVINPEVVEQDGKQVLKCTITNTSSTEYIYGEQPYMLTHYSAGDWVEIPAKEDAAWIEIANIVTPDSETNCTIQLSDLFGKLESGEYRYALELMSDGKVYTQNIAFTI